MNIKFQNAQKVRYRFTAALLAFALLLTGIVWYNAVSGTPKAEAAISSEDLSVAATFYDYYYDEQITGSPSILTLTEGNKKSPYTILNSLISSYQGSQQSVVSAASSPSIIYLDATHLNITTDNAIMAVYSSRTDNNDVEIDGPSWVQNVRGTKVPETNFYRFVFNTNRDSGDDVSANDDYYLKFADSNWNNKCQIDIDHSADNSNGRVNKVKGYGKCYLLYQANNGDNGSDPTKDYNLRRNLSGWPILYAEELSRDTTKKTNVNMPLYFGQFWVENERQKSGTYSATTAKMWNLNNFYWGANLAFRPINTNPDTQPDFYAAATGIVDRKLGNDGSLTQDGKKLPYFDVDWVNNSTYGGKNIGHVYQDLDFVFKNKQVSNVNIAGRNFNGDYYVFDSGVDSVYVNNSGLTNQNGSTVLDNNNKPGFFPFNRNSESGNYAKNNYGFGVKYELSFTLNENGTVDGTPSGIAETFAFKGDDDLWVFVDGNLVLDMGGAHKESEGYIDFKEKKSYVKYSLPASTQNIKGNHSFPTDPYSQYDLSTIFTADSEGKTIWTDNKEHKMTIFYMERGMLESNNYIQFNMSVIPNDNILTITDKINVDNVNAGLQTQTKKIADSDVVKYTIENKGTLKNNVDDTGLLYPAGDFIFRNNQELTSLLSGTTFTETLDSEYIYFSGGSTSWDSSGAVTYAHLYSSGNNYTKRETETVVKNGIIYHRVKNDGTYAQICFGRYNPSNPNECWNTSPRITVLPAPTVNCYTLTAANFSTQSPSRINTTTPKQTDSKFIPSGDPNIFDKVSLTNYKLIDPYAYKGSAKYTGTIVQQTGSNISDENAIGLMYDESAVFTSQFGDGSMMRINQIGTLYKPTIRTKTELEQFVESTRILNDYYSVTKKLLYDGAEYTGHSMTPTAYGDTFAFENPTELNEKNIKIEALYERKVKVGDISITKKLENNNETSENKFTMKITIINLFGSGKATSTQGVTFKRKNADGSEGTGGTLDSTGTFTMKAGETVTIEGIPVGTGVTIEETEAGDYFKSEARIDPDTVSVLENTTAAPQEVTVTNVRKTGKITINKEFTSTVPAAKQGDTFTARVTFDMADNPEGIDLSKYVLRLGDPISGQTLPLHDDGVNKYVEVEIKKDTPAVISNVPYGIKYTVREVGLNDDWNTPTYKFDKGSATGSPYVGTSLTFDADTSFTVTNDITNIKAFLTIEKYIDELYYAENDNPHGFGAGESIPGHAGSGQDAHGYLGYTGASQSFIFEIKEYDTKTDAENGTNAKETYNVVLTFEYDCPRDDYGNGYHYQQSKKFKVNADSYYVVTELNTGLEWRYKFSKAECSSGSTVKNNAVRFIAGSDEKIASFYNMRQDKSYPIESDQSCVVNNITLSQNISG